MDKKYNELVNYLKGLEVDGKDEEKIKLYKLFNDVNDIKDIKNYIDWLIALNKSLVSVYRKVCVENILKIYKEIDADLLVHLFAVYKDIKEKSNGDELQTLKNFKDVVLEVLCVNDNVNEKIANELDFALIRSLEIKDSLYLTMNSKEKADVLFDNCVRRSKLFLKQCDVQNLERLVFCLKNDYSFKDDELVAISSRCASFFASSSASKIANLYKRIDEFKKYIKSQETAMSTALEVDKLLSKKFKHILRDSSSISIANPDSLNKTFKFLMGEKLGELVYTKDYLKDIRGDFTPYQLAKIYNESITSLDIRVDKIADVCQSVSSMYEKVYGEKLDLSKFINGHNFSSISQLRKEDYDMNGKINEIFSILSMFVSSENMENLLRNNLSFLIAPSDAVKISLKDAVLSSSNKDELKSNVLKKIRNHFDIYEGHFDYSGKESSSRIELLNKVNIRNISEEEILNILEKLEVSSDKIEVWSKKWNREEKEYRDLQVQIDLEELLDGICYIEELLNLDFCNVDQYLEDVGVVKEMMDELRNKYNDIVEGKKLNKSLKEIAHSFEGNFIKCENKLNENIKNVVWLYEEKLKEFNKEILANASKIKILNRKKERKEQLDQIIKEKNYSEEELKDIGKYLDDLDNLFASVEIKIKRIKKRSANTNKKMSEDFMKVLQDEGIRRVQEKFNNRSFITSVYNNDDSEQGNFALKYVCFLHCLKFDGFLEEDLEDWKFDREIPEMSYEEYRKSLSNTERKIADEIYESFKKNYQEKKEIEKELEKSLTFYRIDYNGLDYAGKLNKLLAFMAFLKKEESSMKEILLERSLIKDKELEENIESIEDEKKHLDDVLKRYLSEMELLRNSQIKR